MRKSERKERKRRGEEEKREEGGEESKEEAEGKEELEKNESERKNNFKTSPNYGNYFHAKASGRKVFIADVSPSCNVSTSHGRARL